MNVLNVKVKVGHSVNLATINCTACNPTQVSYDSGILNGCCIVYLASVDVLICERPTPAFAVTVSEHVSKCSCIDISYLDTV